jgi:Rrf2 family protein
MLTKKSKYAIKALVAIARVYEDAQPLSVSAIAAQEQIPRKFLEAILLDLKKHGIVSSKQGSVGGYELRKKPNEIVLSQIIRITDGPIALVPCASLNYYQTCEECADENTCALHLVAVQVRNASLKILENTSLLDLVKKEKQLIKEK